MDAIRRVAMTGLLIFIPGNHRATFGFALAVASVILYRDASPFLTQSVNVLGSSAQWLLVVVYFSGTLILFNP